MVIDVSTNRGSRLVLWLLVAVVSPVLVGSRANAVSLESLIVPGQTSLVSGPGTYTVGPAPLTLPANFTLSGSGSNTIVDVVSGAGTAIVMQSGDSLRNLTIDGSAGTSSAGLSDGIISVASNPSNVSIQGIQINNSALVGVVTDQANNLSIQGCTFNNLNAAINLVFSHNVTITGNTVSNTTTQGIQFWGNWKFQNQDSSNLLISGNTVTNSGGGAIWGTGARNVTITNNVVNGASDVGLDLEWCGDSVISGNTVHKAVNAGISLFYSCDNVQIAGNTVYNDYVGTASGYPPAGIWLTNANPGIFTGNTGHQNITITGNTIVPGVNSARRAMWIGTSQNLTIANNAVQGRSILISDGRVVLQGQPALVGFQTFSAPVTANAHSGQNWAAQSLDCRSGITAQIDKIAGTFEGGATNNSYTFQVYKNYNGNGTFSGLLSSFTAVVTPDSPTTILDFTGSPIQLTGSSNGVYYLRWSPYARRRLQSVVCRRYGYGPVANGVDGLSDHFRSTPRLYEPGCTTGHLYDNGCGVGARADIAVSVAPGWIDRSRICCF